eukprot:Filipodium_phascolosomae@DN2391_c0_g1_i4.p1
MKPSTCRTGFGVGEIDDVVRSLAQSIQHFQNIGKVLVCVPVEGHCSSCVANIQKSLLSVLWQRNYLSLKGTSLETVASHGFRGAVIAFLNDNLSVPLGSLSFRLVSKPYCWYHGEGEQNSGFCSASRNAPASPAFSISPRGDIIFRMGTQTDWEVSGFESHFKVPTRKRHEFPNSTFLQINFEGLSNKQSTRVLSLMKKSRIKVGTFWMTPDLKLTHDLHQLQNTKPPCIIGRPTWDALRTSREIQHLLNSVPEKAGGENTVQVTCEGLDLTSVTSSVTRANASDLMKMVKTAMDEKGNTPTTSIDSGTGEDPSDSNLSALSSDYRDDNSDPSHEPCLNNPDSCEDVSTEVLEWLYAVYDDIPTLPGLHQVC